jgi:type I restriction enzyme R subunit
MQRYSDKIEYSQYEGQIQKLIDKHVETEEVKPITKLVNIFEKDKFQQELENTIGLAARADTIASRTAKHISEKMDEDPAFYKKFSELLKEAIHAFEERRITEAEYLGRTKDLMETVLSHTDSDIPIQLQNRDVARAFFGLVIEALETIIQDQKIRKEIATQSALAIDDIIHQLVFENESTIIDWQDKSNIIGKLQIDIGDFIIDEVKNKYGLDLSFDEVDAISMRCIEVAKIRYK